MEAEAEDCLYDSSPRQAMDEKSLFGSRFLSKAGSRLPFHRA